MACLTPTYFATPASNSSTVLPRMNPPLDTTFSMAASTSGLMVRYCATRSSSCSFCLSPMMLLVIVSMMMVG